MSDKPIRFSFSQLQSYIDCGEKYRLRYVEGHKEDSPAWWSVAGNALHAASEEFDRWGRGGDDEVESAAELWAWAFEGAIVGQTLRYPDIPKEQWKTNSKGQGEIYWAKAGIEHLQNYIDWRKETRWEVLFLPGKGAAIEWAVEGHIAGLPFIGYIDRVFITPDGEVVIVDLKSGSRVPSTHLQHGVYNELLEQTMGVRASYGAFFKTAKGELTALVPLDPYHEVVEMYATNLVAARDEDLFTPVPGWLCGTCGVRDKCRIAPILPPPTTGRKAAKPVLRTLNLKQKEPVK